MCTVRFSCRIDQLAKLAIWEHPGRLDALLCLVGQMFVASVGIAFCSSANKAAEGSPLS